MADVNPIPDGYPRISPSLVIDGAGATIDFYVDVLGATVRMRMDGPDQRVGHAELQLGDSVIMVADEFPEMGYLGPKRVGGTPVTLLVYVDDADSVLQKAMSAGATELRPVETQILRRSFGTVRGSVRPSMERGHPRRGRLRGRDDAASEGGHESGLIIDRRASGPRPYRAPRRREPPTDRQMPNHPRIEGRRVWRSGHASGASRSRPATDHVPCR